MFLFYMQRSHVGLRHSAPTVVLVPAVDRWDYAARATKAAPKAATKFLYLADRIVAMPKGQPITYYKNRYDGKMRELTKEEQDQVLLDLLGAVPYDPGMIK